MVISIYMKVSALFGYVITHSGNCQV